MNASLLEVEHVSRRFGGVAALTDVSLSVRKNEILGLIGPNGAGKTTLINIVSGAERPSEGTVRFDGIPAPKSLERAVDLGIARTFQTPRAFRRLTVAENLRLARSSPSALRGRRRVPLGTVEAQAASLAAWGDSVASDLPFGVLRRLSIILALATNPVMLLMDEPCVGLTMSEVEDLVALIEELRDSGLTIVLVEHNVGVVMRLADRITVMHEGSVLLTGSPEECRSDQKVRDVYLGRSA